MAEQNLTPDTMETVQSYLKADSRKVPSVLLEESQKNLGTDDIPNEIFLAVNYSLMRMDQLATLKIGDR